MLLQPPPPPRNQTNSCVVYHFTHYIIMAGLVTEEEVEDAVKCSQTIYYKKNLLGNNFVQTCRQISIYNGMYQGFSYDSVPSN